MSAKARLPLRPRRSQDWGRRTCMGAAPRVSRGIDRCFRDARSPDALVGEHSQHTIELCYAHIKITRTGRLTKVPLPAAQGLEHSGDECADDEVGPLDGNVQYPDEADENVCDLYQPVSMCTNVFRR